MPTAEVGRSLSSFVFSVVDRLVEQGVRSSPLQEEWEAVQQADPDEVEYCRAAAQLGLDPYAEAPRYEKQILEAADTLPVSIRTTFYDAVDPNRIEDALGWIGAALRDIEQAPQEGAQLDLLRDVVGRVSIPNHDHPWRTGWEQAKAVRRAVGDPDTARFDVARFLRHETRSSDHRRIKAIGRAGAVPSGLVVFSRPMPRRSEAFTLARCLWHHVVAPVGEFLVTDSYTDRQKIERAFAAELLAPAAGIRELLEVEPDDAQGEDVDALAESFAVSTTLIELQLQNQLVGY